MKVKFFTADEVAQIEALADEAASRDIYTDGAMSLSPIDIDDAGYEIGFYLEENGFVEASVIDEAKALFADKYNAVLAIAQSTTEGAL